MMSGIHCLKTSFTMTHSHGRDSLFENIFHHDARISSAVYLLSSYLTSVMMCDHDWWRNPLEIHSHPMLCIKMELETNWLLAAVWQPSNTHSGTHGARIVSYFLSHGFSKVHEHIPTTSASQCRFRMVNNGSWSTSAALTSVRGQKMSVL